MHKLKLAALAVSLALTASAQSVSIQLEGGVFRVTSGDLPRTEPAKGWPSIFAVYAAAGNVPPLAGGYSSQPGSLVFRPSFPIAPGVHYRAVFRPPNGAAPVEKAFDGPPRDVTPTARVERIYPSADILPSNQLRLYIYFSAPMSRGEAGQRIHILDERGKSLPGVFLPGDELWDPEFRRFTITFDPGRIKRGLTSNVAMGAPIQEGKRYTLVIDRDWQDARGVKMVEPFRKSFVGGPAQRTPPDPKNWKVIAPRAGSPAAVVVTFPTPMNYPLLLRMLQVSRGREAVAGNVSAAKQETEWRFTPREPWKAGNYQINVNTGVEDLAGNHIGVAFDIDVFEHVTQQIPVSTISLPFTVR